MRMSLGARRLGNGTTRVQWSIQRPDSPPGESLVNKSQDVLTLNEARGSVAFGSGLAMPVSQWDDLSVVPLMH